MKKENVEKFKTSEEWLKELDLSVKIRDADGWDRKNFQYSWYEEKITKREFCLRLARSSVIPIIKNRGEK